jgi:hypothetical protein
MHIPYVVGAVAQRYLSFVSAPSSRNGVVSSLFSFLPVLMHRYGADRWHSVPVAGIVSLDVKPRHSLVDVASSNSLLQTPYDTFVSSDESARSQDATKTNGALLFVDVEALSLSLNVYMRYFFDDFFPRERNFIPKLRGESSSSAETLRGGYIKTEDAFCLVASTESSLGPRLAHDARRLNASTFDFGLVAIIDMLRRTDFSFKVAPFKSKTAVGLVPCAVLERIDIPSCSEIFLPLGLLTINADGRNFFAWW